MQDATVILAEVDFGADFGAEVLALARDPEDFFGAAFPDSFFARSSFTLSMNALAFASEVYHFWPPWLVLNALPFSKMAQTSPVRVGSVPGTSEGTILRIVSAMFTP